MKNLILTSALILTFLFSYSQDKKYDAIMKQTIAKMETCKTVTDFNNTAITFDLISKKNESEWLPLYYHAYSCVIASFVEKDGTKKDLHLDKGEKSITKLMQLVPTESEVYALQAYFYTARLVVNPMARGQKYSGLSAQSIGKSLHFDSLNPRAHYLKISNGMGTAKFFGSSTDKFCQQASELKKNWDDYKMKSELHPTWGKKGLTQTIKSCGISNDKNIEDKKISGHILTIKFTKLSSNEGQIKLEFKNEKKEIIKAIVQSINNNECTVTIEGLEAGKYSVQYYHDENNNGKLDSGKYGKPMEGYGFSNNARGFMAAPKFDKTLFEIKENKTIILKTNY